MLFHPNDQFNAPEGNLEVRRALRLLFDGNASAEVAQSARAYMLQKSGFYGVDNMPTDPVAIARLAGVRDFMADIIEMTRIPVSELDAMQTNSEQE